MKHNKLIKVVSILLVLTYALGTGALAADQIPEFTNDYNTIYVSGSHSWADRYYSTAWWVWDGAEAETRLTGSDAHSVYVQAFRVYAYLENKNKSNDKKEWLEQDSNMENYSNRYVVAETPNLSSKRATYIRHEAWLKINGVYQWPINDGIYELPRQNTPNPY